MLQTTKLVLEHIRGVSLSVAQTLSQDNDTTLYSLRPEMAIITTFNRFDTDIKDGARYPAFAIFRDLIEVKDTIAAQIDQNRASLSVFCAHFIKLPINYTSSKILDAYDASEVFLRAISSYYKDPPTEDYTWGWDLTGVTYAPNKGITTDKGDKNISIATKMMLSLNYYVNC